MKQLRLFDDNMRPVDKHSKYLDRVRVYDNEGETLDRYLVIFNRECFLMSHNPMSPQGVNAYVGTRGDVSICKEKLLDHIPKELLPAVIERIETVFIGISTYEK